MPLTITEPSQVVNGLLTKAIAVRSQALYPMAREDNQVIQSPDVGGFVRIDATALLSEYTVGDRVFFFSTDTDDYRTVGTVEIVADLGGGNIALTTDIPFIFNTAGYVNNLTARAGYHIDIDIFDNASVKKTTSPLQFVPNQAGLINITIGKPLTSLVETNGPFSFEYFLQVTEVWTGSSEVFQTTLTLQAIFGKKQLLHRGGALMFDNLLAERQLYQNATIQENSANLGFIEQLLKEDIDGADITGVDITSRFSLGEVMDVKGAVYNGRFAISTIRFASTLTRIGYQVVYTVNDIDASTEVDNIPQLLTVFDNPIMWTGWNRIVSVLIDEQYVTRNSAGAPKANSFDEDVNHLKISSDVFTDLTTTPTVSIYTINQPTTQASVSFYKQVHIRNNAASIVISEILTYRIEQECPKCGNSDLEICDD